MGRVVRAEGRPRGDDAVYPFFQRGWREDSRVCGNDCVFAVNPEMSRGRPPRVRERLRVRGEPRDVEGKTPACAGTTCAAVESASSWIGRPPRVRADDWDMASRIDCSRGRPPRVRGRPRAGRPETRGEGKISACAGTTGGPRRTGPRSAEDPRVCGDDFIASPNPAIPTGRPPRVRGRLHMRFKVGLPLGRPPRARGGPKARAVARWEYGRPPRVRGRLLAQSFGRALPGKTPARAGTTLRPDSSAGNAVEDPRACGDDAPESDVLVRPTEDPRACGDDNPTGWDCTGGRKTPARAGTTRSRRSRDPRRRKTPARAGTTTTGRCPRRPRRGRPPRVRGRPAL